MEAKTNCEPLLTRQLLELFAQQADGNLPNPPSNLRLPNGKIFVCFELEPSQDPTKLIVNNAAVVKPRDVSCFNSVIAKFEGIKIQDMNKQDILLEQLLSSLQKICWQWNLFFTFLGVPHGKLEEIKSDYHHMSICCFREALVTWLDLATVKAMDNQQKQEQIVKALNNIGDQQLAKKFKWPEV